MKGGNVRGFVGDFLLISKDGREFLVSHCTAPMLNRKGDIIGVVVVFRDIMDSGGPKRKEQR